MAKKKATPTPAPDAKVAGLQAACRDGDEMALLAWADALEEAGGTEAAALLRGLPRAKGEMEAAARGSGDVSLHLPPGGDGDEGPAYWFCGDSEMSDGGPMDAVGPLLARWDEFHPALEWLVRGLGLSFAQRHSLPTEEGQRGAQADYRLTSGDHFDLLPAGHTFSALYCEQSEEGDAEGE